MRTQIITTVWGAFALLLLLGLCHGQVPIVVSQKCGTCHLVPPPRSLAKYAWPKVIQSMVPLIQEQGMPFSQAEADEIVAYYIRNSPEALAEIPDDLAPAGLSFEKQAIDGLTVHEKPEVTSLKLADIDGDGRQDDLVVTDNLNSTVSWLRQVEGQWVETVISKGDAPVNSTPMDIDGDGDTDLGISLMGYMHPNDEMIGEFHLLVNDGEGNFEKKVLIDAAVPRITDCAPGDYDGDGDLDLVIAMFGWRKTGTVAWLRQVAPLQFEAEEILRINGLMRVIPAHLNDDEHMDFLALVTQQHEMLLRFTNDGDGTFTHDVIMRGNYPTFGSSSIYLEDLDEDGDEDIIFTNGDMMDENPAPKPYHGVRWLENDNYSYTVHHLANMPGCYDAKPIDMDGDGDLDLVYSALYFHWHIADFPSLAWLENLGGFREFKARKIAYAPSNLANIAVGDVNGDGLADIFGGGMHVPGPADRAGRVTLWESVQKPAEE